jgi:endonuclease YncB( thermonuclease family)
MPRGKKNTVSGGSSVSLTTKNPAIPPATPNSLDEATYENTPEFSLAGYRTQAKCVRVYDGDTAHFVFSLPPHGVGEASLVRERCRLAGYNTAEMKSKDPEEVMMAQAAKLYLEKAILGKTLDVCFGKYDLYGRPLLTVFIPSNITCITSTNNTTDNTTEATTDNATTNTVTAAEYMISAGLARPYSGAGDKAWK